MRIARTVLCVFGLASVLWYAGAQGTAFTYQGTLKHLGVPANGPYDFRFSLWDAASGGTQIGSTIQRTMVNVQDGLFTVTLDFGNVWDGNPRFLQIAVRPANTGGYTTLSPRIPIMSAPYASFAFRVPWTGVQNAPTRFPPTGPAGGDLAGDYPNPQVVALRGFPVSNQTPTSGQVLQWDGTAWRPGNVGGLTLPFEAEGAVASGVANMPAALFKLTNTSNARLTTAIFGYDASTSTTCCTYGVFGRTDNPRGRGVYGLAMATSGDAVGVHGRTYSPTGIGVKGMASTTTGVNYGVWGETFSPEGYGGYFIGRGYFSGNVGIGVQNPSAKLDVDGTIRTTGFQLVTNPQAGYVLTSDASGNASWQPLSIGGIPAGGDLAGAYPAPRVVGLQGRAVSNASPSDGFVLKWNASTSQWVPAPDAGGTEYQAGDGLQLTGNIFSIRPAGVVSTMLAPNAVTSDKLADGAVTSLKIANGAVTAAKLADGAVLTSKIGDNQVTDPKIASVSWSKLIGVPSASGDVSGTYPNLTVTGLQGRAVSSASPSVGQVLKWNGSSWAPATDETGGGGFWSASGSHIYNTNSGNVGIGTSNPVYRLDIVGDVRWSGSLQGGSVPWARITGAPNFLSSVSVQSPLQGDGTSGNPLRLAPGTVANQVLRWTGSQWQPGSQLVLPYESSTYHTSGTTSYNTVFAAGNTAYSASGFIGCWVSGLNAVGVYGLTSSNNGTGVAGICHSGSLAAGVYGQSSSGYAGYFNGRLTATGTKSFQIDHPLDPENYYLNHFCTEGPEPYNAYKGSVILDERGEAWVQLPDYFESVNRDPTITLTPVGAPMPSLHVAVEVQGNRFKIAGGVPGKKVFWRVEAIRNDPWVQRYGYQTVQPKEAERKGMYLHPELYGQPEDRRIGVKVPELDTSSKSTSQEIARKGGDGR